MSLPSRPTPIPRGHRSDNTIPRPSNSAVNHQVLRAPRSGFRLGPLPDTIIIASPTTPVNSAALFFLRSLYPNGNAMFSRLTADVPRAFSISPLRYAAIPAFHVLSSIVSLLFTRIVQIRRASGASSGSVRVCRHPTGHRFGDPAPRDFRLIESVARWSPCWDLISDIA